MINSTAKKIILSILILAILCGSAFALVGCDNRTALIEFDYVITTQYARTYVFSLGHLLNKPEQPTFTDTIFNAGYGMTDSGKINDFDLPMTNPRMAEGYDVNTDYYFVGWYIDTDYVTKWNFAEDRVYRDMTLYAKWIVKTW